MDEFNANKILNEKEIQQGKTKLDSFARSLIVTLSSRCNISCIMCEVKKAQWDIPRRIIVDIFRVFPYIESIIWQGGEPFFLDYFEEIFDEAIRFPHVKQTIVTNGLLITEKWASKLIDNNVELVFSIDSLTKDVYEHIRKGAQFENVMRGIRHIYEVRKRVDKKKISLGLHVVIMKSNFHQIEHFIDFAHRYEFNFVHFMQMWGNPNSEENIFCNQNKETLRYLDGKRNLIMEKADKYNIRLIYSLPTSKDGDSNHNDKLEEGKMCNDACKDEILCYLPWQQINIDPGGDVRPGCHCLRPVGSVLEQNIRELWNNEHMQEYRQKIINREYESWCNSACLSAQISERVRKFDSG